MERHGADVAILSLTAPGVPIVQDRVEARKLARRSNEYNAQLRDQDPHRWGFFAALPSLHDVEGSLEEIKYALDVLGADGVTLFTRYGEGNCYLGYPGFEPIWQELDNREAVVFIHPTHPKDLTRTTPELKLTTLDYPHETCRTAADLVLSNAKRRFSRCKVILSHAGGTFPWLITRLSNSLRGVPREQTPFGKTYEEYIEDFRSFYYDLALSSSPQILTALLSMVPHDHILYGQSP